VRRGIVLVLTAAAGAALVRPLPWDDTFQAGGLVVALRGRSALAEDGQVAEGHGFGGVALACNARTRQAVDAVLAEAAAGRRILKPARDTFWAAMRASAPIRTGTRGRSPGIRTFS
jgi:hypothetical protein